MTVAPFREFLIAQGHADLARLPYEQLRSVLSDAESQPATQYDRFRAFLVSQNQPGLAGLPDEDLQLALADAPIPFQYASVSDIAKNLSQKKVGIPSKADMVERRANTAPNPPKILSKPGWTVYHGPHGGVGWKNSLTGKVLYATSGSPFNMRGGGKKKAPKSPHAIKAIVTRRRLNAMALARWYADHWNLLADLGLEPSATELHEAGLELYGSGVSVWRDKEAKGKWMVIRLDKNEVRAPGQYARFPDQYAFNPSQARVPAGQGPMVIAGRTFLGGQWVPSQFAEKATPAQKQQLQQQHTESTERKLNSGPADEKGMRGKIQMHVAGQSLMGHVLRHARQTFKALMRHHGELLLHRIGELINDTHAVLETAPEGADEIKQKFGERQAAYGHMLDWAKEQGMTPEQDPDLREPEKVESAHDKDIGGKIEEGLKGVSPKSAARFKEATASVLGRMGDGAKARISANVKDFHFHETSSDVAKAVADEFKDPSIAEKKFAGVYTHHKDGTTSIHTDGRNAKSQTNRSEESIFAHEAGHAIDGPAYTFSRQPEWQEAYKAEMADGQLSPYASNKVEDREEKKHAREGFAEFSRLLHADKMPTEEIQKRFPKSYAFWEKNGILPGGKEADQAKAGNEAPAESGVHPASADEPSRLPAGAANRQLSESMRTAAERTKSLPDNKYGPAPSLRLTGDIEKDLHNFGRLDTLYMDDLYEEMNKTGQYDGNNEIFRQLSNTFNQTKSEKDSGAPHSAEQINKAFDSLDERFEKSGEALDALGKDELSQFYGGEGRTIVEAARNYALAHFAGQNKPSTEKSAPAEEPEPPAPAPKPQATASKPSDQWSEGRAIAAIRASDFVPEEVRQKFPKVNAAYQERIADLESKVSQNRTNKPFADLMQRQLDRLTGKKEAASAFVEGLKGVSHVSDLGAAPAPKPSHADKMQESYLAEQAKKNQPAAKPEQAPEPEPQPAKAPATEQKPFNPAEHAETLKKAMAHLSADQQKALLRHLLGESEPAPAPKKKRAAAKPARETTPSAAVPEPATPAKTEAPARSAEDDILKVTRTGNEHPDPWREKMTMRQLHDKLKEANPNLTVQQMHAALTKLEKEGKIRLTPATRAAQISEAGEYGMPLDREIMWQVDRPRDPFGKAI